MFISWNSRQENSISFFVVVTFSSFITGKYCPCTRSTPLDTALPLTKDLALASIDYINNVKLKNHSHLCLILQLKTIIRAEVEELQIPKRIINNASTDNFTHLYTVLFEVSPSNGIFESELLYDQITKKIHLHNEILRINLYGQSSSCIQDKYNLRSFCYCISYHKTLKNTKAINIHNASNITLISSTKAMIKTTRK